MVKRFLDVQVVAYTIDPANPAPELARLRAEAQAVALGNAWELTDFIYAGNRRDADALTKDVFYAVYKKYEYISEEDFNAIVNKTAKKSK